MAEELPVIFVRGKAATFHLLAPFEPTGWSEEYMDKFVPFLCGYIVSKDELKAKILDDLTNLRFCKTCQKLSELQDSEWAQRITERITDIVR